MNDPMTDFSRTHDKRTHMHTVEVPKFYGSDLNITYASALAQAAAFLTRISDPVESISITDDRRTVTISVTVWVRNA